MSAPIERLDDVPPASDEQHSALYELLVGVASDAPPAAALEDERREEAA